MEDSGGSFCIFWWVSIILLYKLYPLSSTSSKLSNCICYFSIIMVFYLKITEFYCKFYHKKLLYHGRFDIMLLEINLIDLGSKGQVTTHLQPHPLQAPQNPPLSKSTPFPPSLPPKHFPSPCPPFPPPCPLSHEDSCVCGAQWGAAS